MFLSIVTINYNNADGLEKTIESVINQTFADYEYLIIDGNSTDESKDVILKYASKINYWVSEPDKGIYNAMNKGIRISSGKYLTFLNSGDVYINSQVTADFCAKIRDVDIAYGDIIFKKNEGDRKQVYPEVLDFSFFVKDSLPHPCSLIRRDLFFKFGFYDESLKIVADWAFFIDTICKFNVHYQHIESFIVYFDSTGLSSDYAKASEEKIKYLQTSYPLFYKLELENRQFKKQIEILKNSRAMQLLFRLLPNKYKMIPF